MSQAVQDLGREAADRPFLDGDQQLVLARQGAHQGLVQRLGETRVRHRRRQPVGAKLVRRRQALVQARAEAQQRHRRPFAQHPPLAQLQDLAALRQGGAEPLAARIAQRRRTVVDRHQSRHHVHQLRLVRRRHHHEARQAAEIGDVVRSRMGLTVRPDLTGAVDGEANRQALDGDVVHDLVVGALQKRRIDHRERLHPRARQPGRERHRVLLGDADVETSIRELLGEQVETRPRRHRRRHRDDARVPLRLRHQRLGEHLGVARRLRRRLRLLAGHDVELADTVILLRRRLRRRVPSPLLGHHMDQNRARLPRIADVLQDRKKMLQIVAVQRPDIEETQLLEQRAAGQEATRVLLRPLRRLFDRTRELLRHQHRHMA